MSTPSTFATVPATDDRIQRSRILRKWCQTISKGQTDFTDKLDNLTETVEDDAATPVQQSVFDGCWNAHTTALYRTFNGNTSQASTVFASELRPKQETAYRDAFIGFLRASNDYQSEVQGVLGGVVYPDLQETTLKGVYRRAKERFIPGS